MIFNDCMIKSGVCAKVASEIVYRYGNLYHVCWKCARAIREENLVIEQAVEVLRHEEVPS